jgi:alkylated DNA repair dioxygenase AlkB
MDIIQLDDTSYVHYVPNFLDKDMADIIFLHLKTDIDWRESYGRSNKKPLPRLQCWMSDPGVKAKLYQKEEALPWSSLIINIKEKLEEWLKVNEMPIIFDYVLMNKYRNGYDNIGFHRDDEAEEPGKNIIGSLSFGATRKFIIKHRKDKKQPIYEFDLKHGSLIVMSGDTQLNWVHSISEDASIVKSRINLTFRKS